MQTFLTIATVSAAFFWLGRKAYQAFFKKESKCEGCSFSKSSQATEKQLF